MARRTSLWLGAGALLGLTLLAVLPASANPRNKVEQPKYELVAETDDFEVRRYEPRLDASVRVTAKNAKEASNAGFRVLAGFIFGANESRAEIEMTSPVGRSQNIEMTAPVGRTKDGETWTITFTMPKKWTAETLPKPKSDRIVIESVPAQHYAVRQFRGSPSEKVVAEREQELREWAEAAGYELLARPAVYNRYDPPWIPPAMRHNEIWVPIAEPPAAD